MKSKEQIEQLAEIYATSIYGFRNETHNDYLNCKEHCIKFYNKCQEDMADKKYTEEDMLKLWNTLMVAMTNHNPIFFKDYIKSLNKQD
jgi:hypothetical protein